MVLRGFNLFIAEAGARRSFVYVAAFKEAQAHDGLLIGRQLGYRSAQIGRTRLFWRHRVAAPPTVHKLHSRER